MKKKIQDPSEFCCEFYKFCGQAGLLIFYTYLDKLLENQISTTHLYQAFTIVPNLLAFQSKHLCVLGYVNECMDTEQCYINETIYNPVPSSMGTDGAYIKPPTAVTPCIRWLSVVAEKADFIPERAKVSLNSGAWWSLVLLVCPFPAHSVSLVTHTSSTHCTHH